MMASLEARFDAVQDQLMQIFESDTNTLEVQIQYWYLVRREQALYYHARKQGITRLGLYQVPPTRVSEQKAKDAIKMSLYLQKLHTSVYADLPWSLTETSYETFMAKPENTFKKRGASVTVVYDRNSANAMVYTLWKDIFSLDDNDAWHKYHSKVDYDGIYYTDAEGNKVYYVNFSEDAALYSSLGQWEVQFENQVLSPPVTSSVSLGTTGRQRAQKGQDPAGSQTDSSAAQPRQSSASTERGSDLHSRDSRKRTRSESSSRSRSRSPSSGSHSDGGEAEVSSRPHRGHRRGTRQQRREPGGRPPPTPAEVGGRSRTPERAPASRLVQLINEAYDPPILLLQGGANTLKCFRRRANQTHPYKFVCMSTTWTWSCKTTTKKYGHRMLVAFSDSTQRQIFLNSVKLPKGVTFVRGSLDGL